MKTFKTLIIIFLTSLFWSCGSNSTQKKNDFSITTSSKNNAVTIDNIYQAQMPQLESLTIGPN